MARSRLGWLGPAIVIVGVVVALFGGYAILTGRPKSGDVIATIPVDDHRQLVVRAEAGGGERNFVELVEDGTLVWQALTPPYGGRSDASGIAWGQGVVTIRVIRDQRAEIFAVAMTDAAKMGGFKLAPGKGAVVKQATGPITLSDHVRSYEIVGGVGWTELVGIDLARGEGLWRQDLGDAPVDSAGLADHAVWIEQHGIRRVFDVADGHERTSTHAAK